MAIVSKGDLSRTNKIVTANGTTAVVVAYPQMTLGSVVVFSLRVQAGTAATSGPFVSAINPGVGYSFKSTAGDVSQYNARIM